MAMYPKPPMPKSKKAPESKKPSMKSVVPKTPRAMREFQPLSPKDIAKGLGRKTVPKAKKPMTQNRMMKKNSSKGSMY